VAHGVCLMHEGANDAWRDGAENHNPENGEGEWVVRRRNAVRARTRKRPGCNSARLGA
jgi:alkaline phosphatase D